MDYQSIKTKVIEDTEKYISEKAACGEDVQKANILKRFALRSLTKKEEQDGLYQKE